MTGLRHGAIALLASLYLAGLAAGWLAPAGYAGQFREFPSAPPSQTFLLGTDELGRDSFARLLYGSRISLTLAPAAAALATFIGAVAGVTAGYLGGWIDICLSRLADLFLSVPWLFLLLSVRAVLPLNVHPMESIAITFLLLGLLGLAAPARVVRAAARQLKSEDFMLQAQARGCSPLRMLTLHLLPSIRPVLMAQFWTFIPIFILSETNLGFLGLGIAEPLPSWGNLLAGLQKIDVVVSCPWRLAPLVLLLVVMACFHLIVPLEDPSR
ncbi:MAG: binding-protein-dependent transport system inner rane component [Bryobacterales bacterium]|nr:binding-protein-dependent transport system inner rane component [Bryobacterales bacterium]